MPIYEYRCPKCGDTVENYVMWTESPAVPWCLDCGEEMERIMSVPAKPVVRW